MDVPLIVTTDKEMADDFSVWLVRGADDYFSTEQLWHLGPTLVRARENRQLRLKNQELTVLMEFARIMAQPISLADRTSAVLDEIQRTSFGDSATLRVADQDGNMHLIARSGGPVEERPNVQHPLKGLAALAFDRSEVVVANDYPSHPSAEESAIEQGSKSMISLPVRSNGKHLGTVTVVSKEPDHFTSTLVRLLTTLVAGAGTFLENIQLSNHLRNSSEEIALVDQVAATLTSSLDIDNVFPSFAEGLRKLVNFDMATINVIDHESRRFGGRQFTWEHNHKVRSKKYLS